MARNLVDEDETIEHDHAVESWTLSGTSSLTVNGARTHMIQVLGDSTLLLNSAVVSRPADANRSYAMEVHGTANAMAINSRFDAAIRATDNGRIELSGSTIDVARGPDQPDILRSYSGLSISTDPERPEDRPSVVLDGSTLRVAEQGFHYNGNPYRASSGVYMRAGELTLRNGSLIDAANSGVVMQARGSETFNANLVLRDYSRLVSGSGPAIVFLANEDAGSVLRMQITSGSTLRGGDGNLLLVRTLSNTPTVGESHVYMNVSRTQLDGNIVFDSTHMQGSVNVGLSNLARIRGRFFNVTAVGIHANSRWTLTGDSSVGHLALGRTAAVELSDAGAFNALTLNTFTGDGGILRFRTGLEGDTSITDRLVITGDADGHAYVTVTNAGGRGAQTGQGIELIDIDGQSNAEFRLLGRVLGGRYEYFLVNDPNGSWYLQSQLPQPPDLCEADPDIAGCTPTLPVAPVNPVVPVDPPVPESPELPVEPVDPPDPEHPVLPVDPPKPERPQPVLRPETGAYLANHAAMGQLLQYSARDRGTAAMADGLNTWANIDNSERRMDATGMQRLRTQQSRLQVGADLGAFDNGHGRVGVLLSAGRAETSSRSTVTGYRADGKVEGGAAGVYANWSSNGLHVGASAQHGRLRNQVQGEGVALERYDTRAWQTSIEAGYRFDVGSIGGMALALEPQLRLTHTSVSMGTHVESNGTVIIQAGGNGLSSRVGLRLEGEAASGSGRVLPWLAVHAHHAADEVAMAFDGEAIEGGMPRRRVELELGGQVRLGKGLSGWGGIGASHGDDNYRDTSARAGLSYEW